MEENLSSHEKKELKRKLKEEQDLKHSQSEQKAKSSKKIKVYLFGALILIVLIFAIYKIANPETPVIDNRYGAGTAKVIIEEYSDFQCPYCGKAYPTVKQIKETYGDSIEFIYKHFPLPAHPFAQKAAEASECARDQEKFWEYHNKLFENQNALKVSDLKQYASDLELNAEQFNECLDSDIKEGIVRNDLLEGQRKGVTGTPSFFINGKKLVGAQPFSEFKKVIDSELQ